MNRDAAWSSVAYFVDDALCERTWDDLPADLRYVRLVGWSTGFQAVFVAVWSYLGGSKLDDADAIMLATDLLAEKGWFTSWPTEPDYIY